MKLNPRIKPFTNAVPSAVTKKVRPAWEDVLLSWDLVMAIKMTAMCYVFHYSKQVKFDSEKTRQEFPFRKKKLCQTSFLGHSRLDMCSQFCIFLGAQTNGNKLFEYTRRLTIDHALVIGYDQWQLVQKICSNIRHSIAHFKSTRKIGISFFAFMQVWLEWSNWCLDYLHNPTIVNFAGKHFFQI